MTCKLRENVVPFTVALAAAFLAGSLFSATYHVDSTDGDDARDGLSPAAAWRSLDKVNAADVKPGDRVLFRRGGLWRGRLDARSGSSEARTYYGAYGTGPKPIIQGSLDRSRPEDWYELKPGIWSTRRATPRVKGPVCDREALLRWSAGFMDGSQGSMARVKDPAGAFVRFSCVKEPPAHRGFNVQCWGADLSGCAPTLQLRFQVRGAFPDELNVLENRPPWARRAKGTVKFADRPDKDGWREGTVLFQADGDRIGPTGCLHLYLGEVVRAGQAIDFRPLALDAVEVDERLRIGCDVGNLLLGNESAWGVKKWSLEALGRELDYWYDPTSDAVVVKLDRNPAEAYGKVELCRTMTLVPHGGRHDITFEALTLRYTGGFAFSGGGAANVTVRNCDMYFIGGGLQYWRDKKTPVRYGNGIEYWSPARNCLVERCRIWQVYDAALTPQQSGSVNGFDNIVFRDNVIWQAEYAFEYWNGVTNSHSYGVVFEHNTCVDSGYCWSHAQRPDPNGAHMMFYGHKSQMRDQAIRNNVFCRSSDRGARYFTPFWKTQLDLDYNLDWEPLNTLSEYHGGPESFRFGSGMEEFRRYQSRTGLERHSLYAEPVFVDPLKRDYRLKPGTPGTGAASDGTDMGARNMPGLDRDQSVL